MNFDIVPVRSFEKELKKLVKKYPSLKKDIGSLVQTLKGKPLQGISLGTNCYKIRLAISSKNQGKSGGARVIILVRVTATKVYLISIYDKSSKENISDKELMEIIKKIRE